MSTHDDKQLIIDAVKILQSKGWSVGLGWDSAGVSLLYRKDENIFNVTVTSKKFTSAEDLANEIEEMLASIN